MKELSIEEKAKRYDKAIKRAKDYKNDTIHRPLKVGENIMDYIFPELKESEGEGIRKALIKYYSFDKDGGSHALDNITPEQIVTWLEKQGEQKPVFEMKTPEESLGIDSDTYNKIVDECVYGEQKPAWSEEDDAKLKSILFHIEDVESKDVIDWLKNLKDRVQPQPKQWSEEDEQYLLVCKNALAKYQASDKWDATIISRWLEDKLKSIKDRVQPQQKQEWSEEDSPYYDDICEILINLLRSETANVNKTAVQKDLDWLKNLKDRVQPQPKQWSEEDDQYLLVCKNALAKYQVSDKWDAIIISRWLEDKLKSLRPQKQKQEDEWSEEDKEFLGLTLSNLAELKDRYGEGYGKVGKCIKWLNSLQPQPINVEAAIAYQDGYQKALVEFSKKHQEWTEDDIEMIDRLIRHCEKEHEELCNDRYGHQEIVSDLKMSCRERWDWLESLRNKVVPQNTWKPSEEQMNALRYVTNFDYGGYKATLVSLYEQLKKLRGE